MTSALWHGIVRDRNRVPGGVARLLSAKPSPSGLIPFACLRGVPVQGEMNTAGPGRQVEDVLIEALIERRREALEELAKW